MTLNSAARIDWVDYAKGICIIMVVMMHSTLGVEAASGGTGFMHAVVAFAKPFRMPDFFLISGLFLARVIGRDWRTYLDRKVVHFVYFFALWLTSQFAIMAPAFAAAMDCSAISSGVTGRCGDMVGVWMDPVTATEMITLFAMSCTFPHARACDCACAALFLEDLHIANESACHGTRTSSNECARALLLWRIPGRCRPALSRSCHTSACEDCCCCRC